MKLFRFAFKIIRKCSSACVKTSSLAEGHYYLYSIYQHLHIMHKEVQLVNSFVYMPMPEIPGFVVQHLLNGVKPVLRAVINGGLVDSGEEAFCRYILIWAGVGEYHIHRMCLTLLLNILFDRWSRLLVRPPIVSHAEAIELVNTVSTIEVPTDIDINCKHHRSQYTACPLYRRYLHQPGTGY